MAIIQTHTFPLNAKGISEVTIEIGDHKTLSSVSYTKRGIKHRYEFAEYLPSKIKQSIKVEYFKYYIDDELQPLEDLEGINKRFDAVLQEGSTAYFYYMEPMVVQPLGVMIEKMVINGFLISLFGSNVFCFASSNGLFYPPTTVKITITPETGAYEKVVTQGAYTIEHKNEQGEVTSTTEVPEASYQKWQGNSDGTVLFEIIDGVGPYLFSITGKPSNTTGLFTGLTKGQVDYYIASTPAMPAWGTVIIPSE